MFFEEIHDNAEYLQYSERLWYYLFSLVAQNSLKHIFLFESRDVTIFGV